MSQEIVDNNNDSTPVKHNFEHHCFSTHFGQSYLLIQIEKHFEMFKQIHCMAEILS